MRRDTEDPGLSGRVKLRTATPQRPISPPTSSQPSTQPNSPASSHDYDTNGQASQAERKSEAAKKAKRPRETDRKPLTPAEKVQLLKICFNHANGILHAPTGSKSLEDESYRHVLQEFSADVRDGFFKTCAEVNIEVKSICRSRRKRTKGGMTPAKRNPEPEHDACIDQWVRVWKCRELKFHLDKACQLMEEEFGSQRFKKTLGSRLADDDELPDNLSCLILDLPVRRLWEKHMLAVVRPAQEDDGDSSESSTSDESSSDSSDESSDESSDDSSDEEDFSDSMSSPNNSPTPLRSIEKEVDLASSPAAPKITPRSSSDIQHAQSSKELLDIVNQDDKHAIESPRSSKMDDKGKDVSTSAGEGSDVEEESLRFSLTPISRFGNNTEDSSRQILPAAWENSLYDFEPQPSPMFSIRPFSAIMSTPLRATPSVIEMTGLSGGIASSYTELSNEAQINRNTVSSTGNAANHHTSTPATPQNDDVQGATRASQVTDCPHAPASSESSRRDRSSSQPKSKKRSATPGPRKQFAERSGSKQRTPTPTKNSHRAQKSSKSKDSKADEREIRPSVFYGWSSSTGDDATSSTPDQDSRSLLQGKASYITSTFALSGLMDTPASTPRRPFKHYTDSVTGDGDSAWPCPNAQLPSSPAKDQGGGCSHDDSISDMESLPDIEELGRRAAMAAAAENHDTVATMQSPNHTTPSRGRKQQKIRDPGPSSQQRSDTRDGSRSVGHPDSAWKHNNSRDDVSSSTLASRSRSHLSVQSVNKGFLSPQGPSAPEVSGRDNNINNKRPTGGHATMTASPVGGFSSSPHNHHTSPTSTCYDQKGQGPAAIVATADQSSSQGRKRKKSASLHSPPQSSSSSSSNAAYSRDDENPNSSSLSLSPTSSLSLGHQPRKRQKRLPPNNNATINTPADLAFPNGNSRSSSSASSTHHARKHEQGHGGQDSAFSSSSSSCSPPVVTDLYDDVSSSPPSASPDRTRNRTTRHRITPNPHPHPHPHHHHYPNNRRQQQQQQQQQSFPFSTPARQTWPNPNPNHRMMSSSSSPGGSGGSSNLFVSSGSLTPGGWRDRRQHHRYWVPPGQQDQETPTQGASNGRNRNRQRHRQRQRQGQGQRGRTQKSNSNNSSSSNNRLAREMTAATADFEQLSPGRKCSLLRSKNKQLEDKVSSIERTLRRLGKWESRADGRTVGGMT
ncbi:hypothetical protein F4809DRAFT_255288 [Biscogniauxia mediterranea]|nr:hypothetical protein F4809DRAFT_255288 [Biscogniauxia mediterranea]